MSAPDPGTFMVLMLAAALAGLLIGFLPAWRRMMSGGQQLPVHAFLRRQGAWIDGRAALQANIRCAMCSVNAQCKRQLVAGARAPVAGCPNSELLQEQSAPAGPQ